MNVVSGSVIGLVNGSNWAARQAVSIMVFVDVYFSDIRRDSTFKVFGTFGFGRFHGMLKRRKDTPGEWKNSETMMRAVGSSRSQDSILSFSFLPFSLTAFLLLVILSLNNIPVSGLQLDHRDAGSPLASGVADKKDKEQMVVFVIPSSFQPPGKPHHLSLSLCTAAALRAAE